MSVQLRNLTNAVGSTKPVKGYTHHFYRYPARFSPQFVREVITQFSLPNEFILDPFMGGGTTIVEALSLNRHAIGIDLNPLAIFLSEVKTTPLSTKDKRAIRSWAEDIRDLRIKPSKNHRNRIVNLPSYIESLFSQIISNIDILPRARQQRLLRCALLKTGQWAIDCREHIPSSPQITNKLYEHIMQMLVGLDEFVQACRESGIDKNKITSRRKLFCRSTVGIENEPYFREVKPSLVVTSPPYPGVHILYHRWQVKGRRETPAPYWISSLNDGMGESFYTFGNRKQPGLETYFNTVAKAFNSLRQIVHPKAFIIQLIAFAKTESQLPLYLQAMQAAGFKEVNISSNDEYFRISREVPNRKWYSQILEEHDAAKEILLIHQPA